VGVYEGKGKKFERLWRVKTKNNAVAISIADIDGDGIPEVLIGWDNGSFQARKVGNGEVIFKDKMSGTIAGIVCADYRMDGKTQIIICCENGDVKAMLPADADIAAHNRTSVGNTDTGSLAVAIKENEEDQKKIAELEAAKRKLNNELKTFNRNKNQKGKGSNEITPGSLPPNTQLNFKLLPDITTSSLNLRVDIGPEAVFISNIIAVDLEGGVLEQNEVLAISPSRMDKTAIFQIIPRKYHNCSIRIQIHIAAKTEQQQMHVFEKEINIPKFSNFWKLPNETTSFSGSVIETEVTNSNGQTKKEKFREPESRVVFKLDETTQKIGEYISNSFVLHIGSTPAIKITTNEISATFVSVCGPSKGKILTISGRPDSRSSNLDVTIACDDLDVVSEIVQDMAKFFKKSELDSEASFPKIARSFADVTAKVDELNSARNKMAVDTAADSQQIKALIVRAEDSRLMCDMISMKRAYLELMNMNKELIVRHEHRAQVQKDLIEGLKEINLMIHKTSNLRAGKAKEAIVKDCRAAIKANKMLSLTDIMRIKER
jgi:Bardet-Biedl syndrome 2 protein